MNKGEKLPLRNSPLHNSHYCYVVDQCRYVVDNIMPYLHQILKTCLTDVIDKYNIFYCEFRILEKKTYTIFYSNTVDLDPYVTLTFHYITSISYVTAIYLMYIL